MNDIDLSTPQGCNAEIQACSRGLAYMDHLYHHVVDDLREAEAAYESVEIDAARAARQDAAKTATAAEIKAAMTHWVDTHPSAAKDRLKFREARDRLSKIERFMRSCEKRQSAAQSALNGHQSLARYGGGA